MVVTGEQAEGPAVMERWLEGWAPRSSACGRHSTPPPSWWTPAGPWAETDFPSDGHGPSLGM